MGAAAAVAGSAGGLVVGAWLAGVSYRVADPSARLFALTIECAACGAGGCVRRRVARRASKVGRCAVCGAAPAAWVVAAQCACAVIAGAAFLRISSPVVAVASIVVGWLFVGIAICDWRHMVIPHALWAVGIPISLAGSWATGGTVALTLAAGATLALPMMVFFGAWLCRVRCGAQPLGEGDYGVLALVGAAVGPGRAADVLLMAAAAAITIAVFRHAKGAPSAPIPFATCLATGVFAALSLPLGSG